MRIVPFAVLAAICLVVANPVTAAPIAVEAQEETAKQAVKERNEDVVQARLEETGTESG